MPRKPAAKPEIQIEEKEEIPQTFTTLLAPDKAYTKTVSLENLEIFLNHGWTEA